MQCSRTFASSADISSRRTNDIVTVWGQGALKTSGVIMISSVGGAISGSFFRTPAEGLVVSRSLTDTDSPGSS